MRTLLTIAALIPCVGPLEAASITIHCRGRGEGFFRPDRDGDAVYLGGKCSVFITVDDPSDPSSHIQIDAILDDEPSGRLYDSGYGGFHIEEGSIRFSVDLNEGLSGQGSATLRLASIQPGPFPTLHGATGDFQLDDGWATMTGTMTALPEPPGALLLPLGLVLAVIQAIRQRGLAKTAHQ